MLILDMFQLKSIGHKQIIKMIDKQNFPILLKWLDPNGKEKNSLIISVPCFESMEGTPNPSVEYFDFLESAIKQAGPVIRVMDKAYDPTFYIIDQELDVSNQAFLFNSIELADLSQKTVSAKRVYEEFSIPIAYNGEMIGRVGTQSVLGFESFDLLEEPNATIVGRIKKLLTPECEESATHIYGDVYFEIESEKAPHIKKEAEESIPSYALEKSEDWSLNNRRTYPVTYKGKKVGDLVTRDSLDADDLVFREKIPTPTNRISFILDIINRVCAYDAISLGQGVYFLRDKDKKEQAMPVYERGIIQTAKEKLAKELGILPENITIRIEV